MPLCTIIIETGHLYEPNRDVECGKPASWKFNEDTAVEKETWHKDWTVCQECYNEMGPDTQAYFTKIADN